MVPAMQCSRQQLIDLLRRAGFPEVAEAAARLLPDPVEPDRAAKFLEPYGITRDVLTSRIGGSP
jgi:hypothetical protein